MLFTLGRMNRGPHLLTTFGDDKRGREASTRLGRSGATVQAQRSARTSTVSVRMESTGPLRVRQPMGSDRP